MKTILTFLNKSFLIVPGASTFLLQPLEVIGYHIPVLQVIGAGAILYAIGLEFGWYTLNMAEKKERIKPVTKKARA